MVAPDLEIAINFASQAVAADQAGDRATALARYMDAAGALLAIIKVERDAAKAAKLAARMETYVSRGEALKRELAAARRAAAARPPPPPAASPRTEAATRARDARSRVSTGRSYFTADDKFRSDVAAGRAFCAAAEKRGGHYVDEKFQGPAALSRDGYALPAHSARDVAGWVRGGALAGPDGRPVGLFGADGPRPRDVGQGALGDCWLLSSLSVLANFPELVRRLVWAADDSGRSAAGVFAARLCLAGEFRVVTVDDALPARRDGRPAFAGADAGALWPAIVEKAAAKLHGSYGALDSGNAAEALGLLTGLPTRTWPKIHEMLKKPGGLDELHGALVHAHRSGFIISASCGFTGLGADEAQEEKIYDRVGLLNAHEYAVLRVVDVTVGAGKARLVQLRNPWAKREWRGPWSRGGPEWAALPEAARAMLDDGRCLASDDGVFWMALADVAKYFHEVTVCRLRRNFAQVRWPVSSPDALDAPTPAFRVAAPAGEPTTLDACLIQRTERGTAPRGHHVVGDALFLVFAEPPGAVDATAGTHAFTRKAISAGSASLVHAGVEERPGLAPVVATGDLQLAPGRAYLLVPLCLNWRVLGIGSKHALAAVLYSSRPLQHVAAAGLAPDALAAAVRAAVIAKGATQGGAPARAAPGADEDERVYELDGIYVVENRRRSSYLTVTVGLGAARNLVSSRHGGVLDPSKPDDAYAVEDTLPPRSWQIVLARSPYRGSWAIQNTKLAWIYNKVRGEAHRPPVKPGGFHACYPLDD